MKRYKYVWIYLLFMALVGLVILFMALVGLVILIGTEKIDWPFRITLLSVLTGDSLFCAWLIKRDVDSFERRPRR